MIKMQNVILRYANIALSLKLGFERIKNSSTSCPESNPQSADLINKALYLDYVEQVLKNKEADLIELEKVIGQKEKQVVEKQFEKGVFQLIGQMEEMKLMERKLKSMQTKLGIRDEEYISLYRKFQSDCHQYKQQMQESFKKELNDLMNERRILRAKLSQFAELESYQKYLNELHYALEVKSKQIADRESILNESQIETRNPSSEEEASRKSLHSSSNRKRIKIFNTKSHTPIEDNLSFGVVPPLFQNDTFAREKTCTVNTSSAIMAQDSKQNIQQDHDIQQVNEYPEVRIEDEPSQSYQEESYKKNSANEYEEDNCYDNYGSSSSNQQHIIYKDLADVGVQAEEETYEKVEQRLKRSAVLLRCVRKWFKFSFNCGKSGVNVKKSLGLGLWKLNACFDEKISQISESKFKALQGLWAKKQKQLTESKMFPYNELSLKRKKYAELTFDFEQKLFHRKKVESHLKSLLTSKHRKQRLMVYLFFCKFVKNSFNAPKLYKQIQEKKKETKNLGFGTGVISNSDLGSMSSSHVLHQSKINAPQKKSRSSLVNQSGGKVPAHQKSSQKLLNSNMSSKQNTAREKSPRDAKVSALLCEKQRVEKLLATQCVKLQGLIKMSMVLNQSSFRASNYAWRQICELAFSGKMKAIESQLSSMEFKFDVVMTKCRLGLASNSNKISTLQNLLELAGVPK